MMTKKLADRYQYFFGSLLILSVVALQFAALTWGSPLPAPASYAADDLIHLQVKALEKGQLSIGDDPVYLRHDTGWNDGVYETFGLGAAILRLPIESVFGALGFPRVPDKWILLLYATLLFTYARRVGERRLNLSPIAGMTAAAVLVLLPCFSNLVLVRYAAYEEVCAYFYLATLTAFLISLELFEGRDKKTYLLLAAVAGSLVLFRPPGIFYAAALFGTSAFALRRTFSFKIHILAILLLALGPVLQICVNIAKFGSPIEFGHGLIISGEPLNDYATKFGHAFKTEALLSAGRELFAALFFSPQFNGYRFYLPDVIPAWQSTTLRFREFYFTTFGFFDLFWLSCAVLAVYRHVRIQRQRQAATAAVFSFLLCFFFYLRTPGITSRYVADFAPIFAIFYLFLILYTYRSLDFLTPRRRNLFTVLLGLSIIATSGVDLFDNNSSVAMMFSQQSRSWSLISSSQEEALVPVAPLIPSAYSCDDHKKAPKEKYLLDIIYNGAGWSRICAVKNVVSLYFKTSECYELRFAASSETTLLKFPVRVQEGAAEFELQTTGHADDQYFQTFCRAAPFDMTPKINQEAIKPVFIGFNPWTMGFRDLIQLRLLKVISLSRHGDKL